MSSSGVPKNRAPGDEQPNYLVRFGTDLEYADRLETPSEAAVRVGLPHGVSVFQNIDARSGSSVALHRAVEAAGFPVVKDRPREALYCGAAAPGNGGGGRAVQYCVRQV